MLPAKFGILAAALSSCPPCEPPPIQDICGHDLPALPAPTSVEEVAETDATRLMDAFEQGMDLMNSIDCRLPALGTSYTASRTHEGLWAWIKPRLQTLETERMTVSRVGEHSDSSFGAFFPKVLSPIKPYEVMKMLTPQSDRTTKQSPKVGGRKRALKLQSPEDILSDLSGILTQLAAVCEDSDFTSNEEKFSLLSRFSELFASSFPSLDPQLQTVQELCRSAVSVVSNVLMAGAANKYGSPAPLLVVRLLFLFLSIAAIPRGFFRDDVSDSAVEQFISAADEWADALEKSVRGSEDVKEPRKKKLRVAAKSSLSSAVDIAAIQLLTECIRNSLLVLPFTQASRLVQVCGRFLEVASHGFDVLSSSLSSLLTDVILATRMPELVGQLAARFATWDKPKRRWIASDIMISLADSKITDVLGVLVAPFADRTANLKVLVEDTLDSLENIDMPGAVLLLEGILNVVLPSAKDKADMLGLVVSRLFAIQQDAVSFITSFGVEQAAHEDGRAMVQCGHGCARWFPLPAGTPTTPVDWSCIDCRIKSLLPPLPLAGSDNVATGRLAYLICGLSLITQDRASSFVVRCLDTDFAAIDGIQQDQLLPVLLEKSIPTSVAYHVVLTSSSLSPVQFLEPMLDMLLTLFADVNNKCQQRTKAFDTLKSIVQGDRKDRLLDTALGDKHAPIRKAALTIVERDVHVKLIRRVLPLLDDSLKSVRKKTLDTLNKMVRSGSPIAADDAAQIVSRVIYLLSLPIDRKARFFALSAYGADFDHNLIDLLVLLFTVKPELLVGALDLHGELTKQWDSYLEDNWLCRICKTGKLGNDYRNHPILDNYIAHLSKAPVSYALSSIEEAVRCVEASSPSAPADADLHRISFLCRFLENNVLPEPLVLRLTKFGLQRALNPAGNESCHVIMRLLSLLYAYPKVQSVIEKNVIEKPLLELQANSATTASNKVRFMCLLSHALLQFPSRFSVRKLLDVVLNYCHAGSDQPLLSAFALQALIALLCLDPKACMAHQGVLQTILQGATYGDVAQTYLLTSLIRFFKTDTSSLSVALSQTLLQPVCFEVLSSRSPAVRLQAVRWLKTAIDHSLLEPASVAPQILALYADRSDLVTDKASSLVAILPPDAVHTSTLVSASNLAFDRLYASRENHRLFVAGFRQRMSVFHDWLLSPVRKGIISNKAILGWLCDTVRSLCVLDRSVDSAREAELQQAVLKAVNRVLFFAQAFVYLPYQGDEACIVLYQLQTQLDVQLAEYMDESETLSPAVRLLWASSLAVLQQFSLCLRARYCISVADMERVELGSLGGRHAVAKQSVTRERNEVLFHLRGLDSALEAIAAGTFENGQVIAQVDALLDRSSVMLTAGTMDRSFIIGAVKKEDKEDKEDRDDEVDHEDEEEEDDDDA